MDNKQFQQIMGALKETSDKLSIIIAIQKSTFKMPTVHGEERVILGLCNGKNTIDDMMKITNKTRINVKVTLTRLRKKGLIKSAKINKKLTYVKI